MPLQFATHNGGPFDPKIKRRRYCHDCDSSQIAAADDQCFLCDGPLLTTVPNGWVP